VTKSHKASQFWAACSDKHHTLFKLKYSYLFLQIIARPFYFWAAYYSKKEASDLKALVLYSFNLA
jgi:hypothetical protein